MITHDDNTVIDISFQNTKAKRSWEPASFKRKGAHTRDVVQQFLLCSLLGLTAFHIWASFVMGCQFPVGPERVSENINVVNHHLLAEDPVYCVSDLPIEEKRETRQRVLHNYIEKKNISACWTLRWVSYNRRKPHWVPLPLQCQPLKIYSEHRRYSDSLKLEGWKNWKSGREKNMPDL